MMLEGARDLNGFKSYMNHVFDTGQYYVVKSDGRIVAGAGYYTTKLKVKGSKEEKVNVAVIASVFVLPQYRRQKIATELFFKINGEVQRLSKDKTLESRLKRVILFTKNEGIEKIAKQCRFEYKPPDKPSEVLGANKLYQKVLAR